MSDAPQQIGPYRLDAEIGRGGMGVVYRAIDTRLDRAVAIKALPEHLAEEPDRLARFEREARLLASLNHPNVAGIHGVEEHEGRRYLVLEFVDGQTLAERLDHGPLSVDEAIEFCAQIAAGVDAAHEAGVIHRDLKPGNIIITPDGMAKVLDFGLARADESSSSSSSMSMSPTLTSPAQHSPTSPGVIMGTAAYMSPEQARGRTVDRRTDIWSFGVILYECLTGANPFAGDTVSDSIGAILHKPIDLDRLPPGAPPRLRRTIERCLERDRRARWRDIGDVRLELLDADRAASEPAAAPARRAARAPWALAIVAMIIALAAGAMLALDRLGAPPERPIHLQLTPPEGWVFDYRNGPPALSPDGRHLAFVAHDESRTPHVFVRDLARPEARRIEGVRAGAYPFWSPDSRSLGFFDGRHLRRIDIGGGPPDTVCEAAGASGATWSRDGVIVFATGRGEGLSAVDASGGTPRLVTTLDRTTTEFWHASPWFLPDGERFFFSTRRGVGGVNGVSIGSLDGSAPRRVLDVDSNAVYVEPGFVLFWRDGALRAQRFDLDTESLVGDPVVVAPRTRYEPAEIVAMYSASPGGALAYHPGQSATAKSRLLLFDRAGAEIGQIGPDGNYYSPRLSHDGRFVAVDNSGVSNNGDIWIYGVDTTTAIRLTNDPADESRPVWSPDDTRIAFLSGRSGPDDVLAKRISNPAATETIASDPDHFLEPTDWSPDGAQLAINRTFQDFDDTGDIVLVTVATGEAAPFLESPFMAEDLRFSPDGAWCAYTSNETGRTEVYLQSMTDPRNRRVVSSAGGDAPRWRDDGRELFYRALDDMLMAVALPEGPEGAAGAPTPLFRLGGRFGAAGDFDIAGDGQTILINRPIYDEVTPPMSIVLNWMAEIERR